MNGQAKLQDWLERAKQRGQAPFLLTLLDAIEPAAPVLAQGLLVAQPLANLWGEGLALRELAHLLEEPDGIRQLRRQLSDQALE